MKKYKTVKCPGCGKEAKVSIYESDRKMCVDCFVGSISHVVDQYKRPDKVCIQCKEIQRELIRFRAIISTVYDENQFLSYRELHCLLVMILEFLDKRLTKEG